MFPSAGVKHEELVSLAKSHFSGVSFEYEGDAVPLLSPCRFTGSEVSYVGGVFHVFPSWFECAQPSFTRIVSLVRSVCATTLFLWRTSPSLSKEPA